MLNLFDAQTADKTFRAIIAPRFSFGSVAARLNWWNRIKADPLPWALWLVSVAVYLPAISWGLPSATHPGGVHGWDSDSVAGMPTLAELHNLLVGSKPDWYVAYPLFHYLLLGVCYAPYVLYAAMSGGISHLSSEYPYGLSDPVDFIQKINLIGRCVTLLMASGLIVTVYLTARAVWNGRAALLAALTLMLATPMFYYSRTGNLDVPVLFWTGLGLMMVARWITFGPTVRRGIFIGLFAALSVATKDQAAGPWLMILATIPFFQLRDVGLANWRALNWKAIFAIALAGAVFYSLASGLVFRPDRFRAHILYLKDFSHNSFYLANLDVQRPHTLAGTYRLGMDVVKLLLLGLGPIFIGLGVAGLVMTWRSCRFTKVIGATVFGFLFFVIWPIRFIEYRYTLILVLSTAFLAGRAADLLLSYNRVTKIITAVTLSVGFMWLGARGADVTYQMLFDARNAAGEWFAQHGKPGEKVIFFGSADIVPALPYGMSSHWCGMEPDRKASAAIGLNQLESGKFKYLLVAPDFSSEQGMDRSKFFPDEYYRRVVDGSLGYKLVASFRTPPLFNHPLLAFPVMSPGYFINPPVKIYALAENSASG